MSGRGVLRAFPRGLPCPTTTTPPAGGAFSTAFATGIAHNRCLCRNRRRAGRQFLGLLRDTVRLGLQAVPDGIALEAARRFSLQQPDDEVSVLTLHL